MEYTNRNHADYIFSTSINNITFKNCCFSNAIFQDISINNVQFIDCELNDVVINNCYIANTKFVNETKEIPQITVLNCEIIKTSFCNVFFLLIKIDFVIMRNFH